MNKEDRDRIIAAGQRALQKYKAGEKLSAEDWASLDHANRVKLEEGTPFHNAAMADPLARERAEAERLAALIRECYGTPGAFQCVPDGKAANLIGRWRIPEGQPWPRDVQAVNAALACLKACEGAQTIEAALFHGKRLIALLRDAQAEMGEEPEPLALSLLTMPSELDTLSAMAALPDRVALKDLIRATNLSDKAIRNALRKLVDCGLVMRAGTGAGMRYTLTCDGRQCAEWTALH